MASSDAGDFVIEQEPDGLWSVRHNGRTVWPDEPTADDCMYYLRSRRISGEIKVVDNTGYATTEWV